MTQKYDHTKIEHKWQAKWEGEKLYVADIDKGGSPFFNLWMFPYPSAEGLHAGHAFASTGSDIYGRFMRMKGHTVFQPIGYDSFGIHSENYAIKINENPHEVVKRTTKHYEEQMRSLGHGYDWTRTVTTSDPDYYKWTQWLFVKMFEAGLAYKKNATVNFCPSCKTVLADEQVMTPKAAGKEPKDASGNLITGNSVTEELRVCERCGTVVEKKDLDQWFFKITKYADRLLSGLDKIDWSERVSKAQRDWIGKKAGVQVDHKVKDMDMTLTAFSAYPAWLFADTFLVIAPEHPRVLDLVRGTKYENDVLKFVENFKINKASRSSKLDEKEGIFTGRYVVDSLTGREFPVWLANFALMDFGTGIIRCSAHDPRDYEFANKYDIHLEEVVKRTEKDLPVNAHLNEGILINSGSFTGRSIDEKLINDIVDWIGEKKYGQRTTNYHLRDWLVSRQRYWGAPIPMINCPKCGWVSVPEKDLPVLLPNISDYKPEGTGRGPLANHKEFYETKCPSCGGPATRETDVMDTFVDSSWYFLRYPSVGSDQAQDMPFDTDITKKWLPVNLYFGGAEHSVLHLMYARFVTMALHDMGKLDFDEPFPKFFAHGLMIKDGAKMSKSRGNVVNPDEYIAKFGADVMRMYNMFIGPMDGSPDFRDSGIEGMQRFMGKVWKLFENCHSGGQSDNQSLALDALESQQDPIASLQGDIQSKLHLTIKGVTEDVEQFKYNTAISKIMQLVNTFVEYKVHSTEYLEKLALLLAPFAPHMMEEVWVEVLGQPFSVHKAEWPKYDPKLTVANQVMIIVQINGKMRGQIEITQSTNNPITQLGVEELAKEDQNVAKWLMGKEIKKTIFIPGKVINFVV